MLERKVICRPLSQVLWAYVALCVVMLMFVVCGIVFSIKSSDRDKHGLLTMEKYRRRVWDNGVTDHTEECGLPLVWRYRAWDKGLVTELTPQVQVNCSRILHSDEEEIMSVNKTLSSWTNAISDSAMLEKMRNCSWLNESFADNFYVSELEKSFPLAFTFVVHDSPQQVLRLLRVLYRPHNTYCIHYDNKSSHAEFFESIAACFENVVVPSEMVSVTWGHYSVLGAQMQCMSTLHWHRNHQPPQIRWKYLLNLCGKELPLATNREIVTRLSKLNGTSSLIPRKVRNSEDMDRLKYLVKINMQGAVFQDKSTPLYDPPFNLSQYYKSQAYVALSFQFVEHLLTNERAKAILDFFKQCKNPEEHYYATMFMLPGVPGGYKKNQRGRYFVMESVDWSNTAHNFTCSSYERNHVCITSARDLGRVLKYSNTHLFHNKYVMDYDHVVMMCVEEELVGENKMEYLQDCRDSLTKVSS